MILRQNQMSIYLNNAATTYPKPPTVLAAMAQSLAQPPREAGRSSGMDDVAAACRREAALLFEIADERHVVLTPSATHAINLVIQGLLAPGYCPRPAPVHVITTVLEHNSVLRPLEHLRQRGWIDVSWLRPGLDGCVHAETVAAALRESTLLVAVSQVSNVTGWIQPVEEIAAVAAASGVPFLIDASQGGGAVDLCYRDLPGRVFLAVAGHKGLFGPMGTGLLVVPDGSCPQTLVGGTGVHSESLLHPDRLPVRHEAGTPNLPGIAGLIAGLQFVRTEGVDRLGRQRSRLVQRLRRGLARLPEVHMTPLPQGDGRAGIVSFTLAGWKAADAGFALSQSFGIEIRAGLHCAPLAHRELATAPEGNIRVGLAAFNNEEHVDELVAAVQSLVEVPCAV